MHCCSEWGHDFRPDYRYLGLLRNLFQGVPTIGLTATATTFVLNDVREMLEIPAATIIKAPFDRTNLCFKVHIQSIHNNNNQSVIIVLKIVKTSSCSLVVFFHAVFLSPQLIL